MLDKSKRYLIVGLGLLGGKYALELTRAGYTVDGINRSEGHLQFALDHGYIRSGKTHDFEDLVQSADHIIFALYPTAMIEWFKTYGSLLKPGCIFTDVSGVKTGLVEPIQALCPDGVEFIASHPMAGRETSSVEHAAEVNFAPANFIITPTEKNTPEAVQWARELAEVLGFKHICTLTVQEHDKMIGYVSQLCHAIAVSLMCANDNTSLCEYTGDSFRDLTRIARINDKMWAELFLWNKENLIAEIDQFDAALSQMRNALVASDRDKLEEMFRLSTQRQVYVDGRPKSANKELPYSVDALFSAINKGRMVQFRYKKVGRPETRTISPWQMVWENGCYYLIAYQDEKSPAGIRHYRVDKMAGVLVLDAPRRGKAQFAGFDLPSYLKKHFNMYGGPEHSVTLRCTADLEPAMRERFGTSPILIPEGGTHFHFTVPICVSDQFYGWVCGFGGKVEITAPAAVRSGLQEMTSRIAQAHQPV